MEYTIVFLVGGLLGYFFARKSKPTIVWPPKFMYDSKTVGGIIERRLLRAMRSDWIGQGWSPFIGWVEMSPTTFAPVVVHDIWMEWFIDPDKVPALLDTVEEVLLHPEEDGDDDNNKAIASCRDLLNQRRHLKAKVKQHYDAGYVNFPFSFLYDQSAGDPGP